NILLPVGLELCDLVAPDLIDRLVEGSEDVEAIENVQRLRGLLGNDLEIRRPHIAAYEPNLGATLFAELVEEAQQCFRSALGAAPQKPRCPGVNLVDQCQVFVPLKHLDFIDAAFSNAFKAPIGQAIIDDEID